MQLGCSNPWSPYCFTLQIYGFDPATLNQQKSLKNPCPHPTHSAMRPQRNNKPIQPSHAEIKPCMVFFWGSQQRLQPNVSRLCRFPWQTSQLQTSSADHHPFSWVETPENSPSFGRLQAEDSRPTVLERIVASPPCRKGGSRWVG